MTVAYNIPILVVDNPGDSITTTTIPDFVTNISAKPSKGKERDEGDPPNVTTALCEWNV